MSPFFQKDSLHFSQVKLPVKKRQDCVVFDGWMDGSFATENNAKNQSGETNPKRKILHLTNLADFRKINNFDVTGFFSSFGKKTANSQPSATHNTHFDSEFMPIFSRNY